MFISLKSTTTKKPSLLRTT